MERIRIMVVSVPGMLGEILQHAIGQSADLVSVATLSRDEDPRLAMVHRQPQVVVLGMTRDPQEGIVAALLRAVPSACVVTLSAEGKRAVAHRVSAQPLTLEDASPQELLRLVRLVARS